MALRLTYSQSLRIIGQALEKMGVDLFDLRCREDNFYLQCGDPTPPHLTIIDLRYSPADIRSFDIKARARREESFRFVEFNGLPEILRAVGHHVESKDGQLRRICNCESLHGQETLKFEYETRDGRTYVEELLTATMSDYAMHLYKGRARINQDRARK